MITDSDQHILDRYSFKKFYDEIVKELKCYMRVIYMDYNEFGECDYKTLRLVYYYFGPKFVNIDFLNDWNYDLNKTIDENTQDVANLMLKRVTEHVSRHSLFRPEILSIYEVNLLKIRFNK